MQHARTIKTTARWFDAAARALIGATAVVAAGVALTGIGPGAASHGGSGRLRTAMAAYEARQWPQAFAQLSAAADAGDAAAARVATMMARQGPLLFGQRFDAGPERLRRWDRAMRGEPPPVLALSASDGPADDGPRAVRVAGAR